MNDNTKIEFSRAVFQFESWKLAKSTGALPWWWASCTSLTDNEDRMPEELSVVLDGAISYSDGALHFRKQLVSEIGSAPPSSGWSGR